jgi:hypothetical protein
MATKQRRRSGDKCLNCPNKVSARGCCINCLHAAHRLIRIGEKTEQELIDAGVILPTRRRGRKIAMSPVLKKLAKVKV